MRNVPGDGEVFHSLDRHGVAKCAAVGVASFGKPLHQLRLCLMRTPRAGRQRPSSGLARGRIGRIVIDWADRLALVGTVDRTAGLSVQRDVVVGHPERPVLTLLHALA